MLRLEPVLVTGSVSVIKSWFQHISKVKRNFHTQGHSRSHTTLRFCIWMCLCETKWLRENSGLPEANITSHCEVLCSVGPRSACKPLHVAVEPQRGLTPANDDAMLNVDGFSCRRIQSGGWVGSKSPVAKRSAFHLIKELWQQRTPDLLGLMSNVYKWYCCCAVQLRDTRVVPPWRPTRDELYSALTKLQKVCVNKLISVLIRDEFMEY